ncbi:hypothetical protein [Leptolyngbya sp. O-77]|uniref:hypothetical protein n=1 Tax=Leptolyngbya sp. O-77 TaxID=1080068 RepID=UPI000B2AAD54|nr:hypothetical protein [Leptolyngbya sp. O-77]
MTFQSLQRVLGALDRQPSWRSHRQIQQILAGLAQSWSARRVGSPDSPLGPTSGGASGGRV